MQAEARSHHLSPNRAVGLPARSRAPSSSRAWARKWIDQSVDGIARRMATAMDRSALSARVRFRQEGHGEEYGENRKTRVCTILRGQPRGADTPCMDIYGMDYRSDLTRRFEAKATLVKSLMALGPSCEAG